jgi:hypothetical protein
LKRIDEVNADKRRSTAAVNAKRRDPTHHVNGRQRDSNQGLKMKVTRPFGLNSSLFGLIRPLLANAASTPRCTLFVDEFGNRE